MTVRAKAEALIKDLQENGFNDVDFETAEINSRDKQYKYAIEDGYSPEIAKEWCDDYVTMSLMPDMEWGSNEYNGFDSERFEYDLRKKVIQVFGEGCLKKKNERLFSIDLWGGEFEIYDREKYERYWREKFQ